MPQTVRKIPMRKCTGCQEMVSKKDLIRVLLEPDGRISIDTTGKKNGRGAYLCKKKSCLEKALKNKGLEKSLKCAIPDDIKDKLKNEYEWLDE